MCDLADSYVSDMTHARMHSRNTVSSSEVAYVHCIQSQTSCTHTSYEVRSRVRVDTKSHTSYELRRRTPHACTPVRSGSSSEVTHTHFTYSQRNSRLNSYDTLDFGVIYWSHSRRRPVVGTKMCWKSQYFHPCLLIVWPLCLRDMTDSYV